METNKNISTPNISTPNTEKFKLSDVEFYSEVQNIMRLSEPQLISQIQSGNLAFSFSCEDNIAHKLVSDLLKQSGVVEVWPNIYMCMEEQYRDFMTELKKYFE